MKKLWPMAEIIMIAIFAVGGFFFLGSYIIVASGEYEGKPVFMIRDNPYVMEVIEPKFKLFGVSIGPLHSLNVFTKKEIGW